MFMLLMVVFVLIYSLLGVELFAEQEENLSLRYNFNTFPKAVASLFICFIGDDWPVIMHNYMNINGDHLPSLYVIPWVLVSQMFLMNIFFAIHIKNY